MRGDWVRVSRTTKTAAMIIATVTLICGAAGSLFGAPDAGLAALKRQYWRPAGIPYPKDNPYGRAKEELGRALFFDPILSGARVRSCATYHNPGLSWGDGEPRAIGENQIRLPLRSPTLLNIAWVPKLGWDAVPRGSADELGALLAAMGVMRDNIKAMMDREVEQRRNAQARLADALECSQEGVVVDANDVIVLANAQAV